MTVHDLPIRDEDFVAEVPTVAPQFQTLKELRTCQVLLKFKKSGMIISTTS
jgi:hypothetical protein